MSLLDRFFGKGKPTPPPPVRDAAPVPPSQQKEATQKPSATAAPRPGPNRPVLYAFQFVSLPEAAFQNHPELVRELSGERSLMPLLHFRSKAHLRCMQAGMVDPVEDRNAAMLAEHQLFSAVGVHPHKRDGYTAYVVTMPSPEAPPEAYFTAILWKDDEPKEYMRESSSTRYFTLEKSVAPLPVLCECLRGGSRRNFGPGPAPDMAAFVEAVFERCAATKPGSNRVFLEGGFAGVMMFAQPSATGIHSVTVTFEDGTVVEDAKVYRLCELELPPPLIGKTITELAINPRQP